MARKIIDIGTVGNDGTGDSIRDSFRKVNDNFRELYSSLGLGEKLKFIGLDDTPEAYLGQENAILSVNNTETGLAFKQIIPGSGIQLDFTTSENEIRISSEFSEVVGDTSPQLGGPLSAFSGGNRFAIGGMIDLNNTLEFQNSLSALSSTFSGVGDSNNSGRVAVNKAYADRKIDRAGVLAIDPATGEANSAFGTMTGPLVLARDPIPDDDETYDGLIAATKRYVDNSAFGSSVNLYVATSGADERVGVSPELQGRALAYAYRTLEAALKRAEELVLESRQEIGPYKKILTYNNGVSNVTLDDITEAPASGSGFEGTVLMSVDSITINNVGVNYNVGDIITIAGGTYTEPARYEVLSTATTPGAVVTFRQLSSGVYTELPGSTDVSTTSDSAFGTGVTFDLTYKVNNVQIVSGGSGYGLVSVRIVGGGGAGAFGTADVVSGIVQSITITDQGSGFSSLPAVVVNLPRFLLRTEGFRTDFTGDVETDTPTAIRGRDVREGLFLRGETSGALAQILSHEGALDSDGNEIFDVDIKYGSFVIGEEISYGDVAKQIQITVLVESGLYEENLPLRVPANVSIVGDEFRRCIIRPKPGVSSSPWAFINFRRDLTIGEAEKDQLTIADRLFGYHYLTDSAEPVYPIVNNKGYYRAAAELLRLNRAFIQKEVILWIADQSRNEISPFFAAFSYDEDLCERDVGLIIDAMIFDLKWGGSDRTVSAALKYFTNASGRLAITTQLAQTVAAIRRINTLAQLVIRNVPISETYQIAFPQIVDGAYIAEVGSGGTSFNITGATSADPVVITTETAHGLTTGDQVLISDVGGTTEINGNDYYVDVIDEFSFYIYSDAGLTLPINGSDFGEYTSGGYAISNGGVIGALIDTVIDVIDGSGSVNYPLDNDRMDVFLCNDSVRLQAITCQQHGGFMMVLDPYGQVLSRSPYAQECASFSKSTGRQRFGGGMYIDGFAGNLRFKILSKDSDTYLRVGELQRMPQLPASFIVADTVYRINYVRDFVFNVAGSTASFILDETTPWTFDIFDYDEAICYRDAGLILDGVGYDIVLGTNYHARKSGFTYRQGNAAVVVNDQLDLTTRAIEEAHRLAAEVVGTDSGGAVSTIENSSFVINNIIRNGFSFAPPLLLDNPPDVDINLVYAKQQLQSNINFLVNEVVAWIDYNIANGGTIWLGFTYDSASCERDVGYIVDAIRYDFAFNVNYRTISAALRYLMASASTVFSAQKEQTLQALVRAKYYTIAELTDPTAIQRAADLWNEAISIIREGGGDDSTLLLETAGTQTLTVPTGGSNNASDTGFLYARQQLQANKAFIQDEIISWIADQVAGPIAPFTGAFTYNEAACNRDVGLIIDALIYDLNYGGNLQTYDAAKAYYDNAVAQYGAGEKDEILAALARLKVVVGEVILETTVTTASEVVLVQDTSGSPGSVAAQTIAEALVQSIYDTISTDGTLPTRTAPDITWTSATLQSEFALLDTSTQASIGSSTTTWIDDQITAADSGIFDSSFTYNDVKCARDTRLIVESLTYDLLYGGNSQTRDAASKYYSSVIEGNPIFNPGEEAETAAAVEYLAYLANQILQNQNPTTIYSSSTRIAGTAASVTLHTTVDDLLQVIADTIRDGLTALPEIVYPDLEAYSYNAKEIAAREQLIDAKTTLQEAVIAFVDDNANAFEVLMPGNRSMLSNDFTQINDLGYGVVVNNGGLAEAVSMFTYYCHISYYAVNGGQIRSVGGSSAHGNYALVAEGADPLEVPTPVTLYYELAQGLECYFPSPAFANTTGGLSLYVTNYSYIPLDNSELEVDHGLGEIYRYPVTSVAFDDSLPPGVVRLSLGSSEGAASDGLAIAIPDGTKMTIRSNAQVILTGDVTQVAVRPSTGLVLRESPTVYRVLQFEAYDDPIGARTCTISTGSTTTILRTAHGLQPGYQIELQSTGELPEGLSAAQIYWVMADDYSEDSFLISTSRNGLPVSTTTTGSGTFTYTVYGLARTSLRENYNYVDMTVWPTQPYTDDGSDICTISIASPAVVTLVDHGFEVGDVLRFETDGSLPTGVITTRHYFVHTVLSPDTFTITVDAGPDPVEVDTSGSQSGTHRVGKVIGRVGDSQIAIVPLGSADIERLLGTKMIWIGEEYVISAYSSETITEAPYALITLDRPLVDSVIAYSSMPTLKSAVSQFEPGTLTIRIALTRVTSHDLLEIGTGSYADTNYPNEIYGPAVNALNPSGETEERGVGRCFYVTTDQFGNFSVGPYFRVDQGTGTVTFAASIALSNLDGIGFKRGVPVAEFSTDSSFADNATDTVATENATRGYIERRLGLTHNGVVVAEASLIPPFSGGFMSLDGQLPMKNDMDVGGNKIINVADPVDDYDAVNRRSLVFANFADFNVVEPRASDLLIFTGNLREAQNATVVGDLSFDIDSTAFTIDAQINPEVILDADINPAAGIQQSKLLMNSATTRANATGITQADKGVASFDSAQFTATDGWITVKDNGLAVTKIAQIATKTVLGNSSLVTGNVSAVPFSTVVNDGLAIKKSQYNTGTGYLRRIGFTATQDTDYTIVDEASTNTPSTLVKRDSNGDFSARNVSVAQLKVDGVTTLDTTTSATGGYLQIYGFSGQVGILIGDGSVATDKRTFYDNDSHIFRTQNGLSNGDVTVGTLTATAITTGGTSTAGTITGTWSLASGSRLQATYADLAEYYEADKEYPVGTVLVFGGDKEVTVSNSLSDHRIAGVVSDNAAYTMNQDCPGTKVLIALQGRVPCRVVGKINKGDLMVTSKIQGVAVSVGGDARAGTIIGKALENYDSDHIGTIEVAVGRA